MNVGSIHNASTQPARMYRLLQGAAERGIWMTTRELAYAINSCAASTVISQVRDQLPEGEFIERERGDIGGHTVWRYRLRVKPSPGQVDLFPQTPQPAAAWTGEPV